MMSFVNQVENLSFEPDSPATVVIDEISGVIVMGENVRVSTVAIQQGNLTITVRESSQVSQPNAFSKGGTTAIVPQSDVSVDEEKGKKFVTLKSGASLSAMVSGLNALGVTPRDMISILQSIKTAGALQADIKVQ
jgi:flagellar P-ring protein precursor FlgI